MSNIFTKILKTIPNYSGNKIDTDFIKDVYYKKRLFRIFEFDKPYTLYIKYYCPKKVLKPLPISAMSSLSGMTGNVILNESIEYEHLISKRYATKEAILFDIKEIRKIQSEIEECKKLQGEIEEYKECLKHKILEKFINRD